MAHAAGGVIRPIVPVQIKSGEQTLETYAMLDSAADKCAILPSLVEKLEMNVKTIWITLTTVTQKIMTEKDHVDNFLVESLDGTCSLSIDSALVSENFTTA